MINFVRFPIHAAVNDNINTFYHFFQRVVNPNSLSNGNRLALARLLLILRRLRNDIMGRHAAI